MSLRGFLSRPAPDVLDIDSGIEALRTSPEFTGTVEAIEDGHACNDHLALLYETRQEQLDCIVPFVRQGLERGERCMYVVDEIPEETLLAALREGGVDVDAALSSGALSFHTVDETYLRRDAFDPDEMVAFYADAIADAKEEFSALRVAAETTWMHDPSTTMEAFLEYESKVNALFADEDCIALCQYDRTAFDPEVVRDLVRTHPHLIYEGTVCHNFYYTPPEEFLAAPDPQREVERMMGTLLERTEAKTALQERRAFLRDLYDVIAGPNEPFEATLQELLELGCEWFDLDVGALNRVDPDSDTLEVEHVSGDHEHFVPGAQFPLSETYCQAAADVRSAASVADPCEAGYDDITVYEDFGVQGYLGTYIPVEGGADRTLGFVSTGPTAEPPSEADRTHLDLMGQWAKYELERRHRERDLRQLYEIAADGVTSFEEKIEQILAFGCERFGLDQGYLVDVHHDGTVEIEAAVGPPDQEVRTGIPAAQPEEGHFCRLTVESDELVAVTDAGEVGWDDDPVYRESATRAYFGATVTEGDGTYGTLAFCDTSVPDRPFTDAERTLLEVMSQWVSHELKQRRREAQLAALNDMSRDITGAETRAAIAERTVAHAQSSLRLPVTAIVGYDGERGELTTAAGTPRAQDELPTAPLCDRPDGPLWEAFVAGEVRRIEDPQAYSGSGDELTELLAVPLGRQGLFVSATTAPGGIGDADCDFLAATAATVEAAYTRADREQQLRRREETLAAKNETLERLNRVNDIIRNIDQALVGATSREDIEAVVCRQLAEAGPYELAWLGEPDPVSGDVAPEHWAGAGRARVDELRTATADAPDGGGPVERVLATREPQVVNDVLEGDAVAPWRQAALNRGYHACVALPLSYGETLYGVLTVYAGQPGVFGDLERSVLSELADTIGYAINAVESKKAIVSDEVTHLEFDLDDAPLSVVELAREFDCEVSLESIVPDADGAFRAFVTTRGTRPETLREAASALPVRDVTLVAAYEQGGDPAGLFEARLTDECLFTTVLEHGGRPVEFTVADGQPTVTVEVAADAAVREFVEMVRTQFPGTELVAQRSRQRPQQTPAEFLAGLTETLTDRQLEALQMAYYSGYLEEPRQRSATDLADAMDISQPTFNSHLRAAQRKLCEHLFYDHSGV